MLFEDGSSFRIETYSLGAPPPIKRVVASGDWIAHSLNRSRSSLKLLIASIRPRSEKLVLASPIFKVTGPVCPERRGSASPGCRWLRRSRAFLAVACALSLDFDGLSRPKSWMVRGLPASTPSMAARISNTATAHAVETGQQKFRTLGRIDRAVAQSGQARHWLCRPHRLIAACAESAMAASSVREAMRALEA